MPTLFQRKSLIFGENIGAELSEVRKAKKVKLTDMRSDTHDKAVRHLELQGGKKRSGGSFARKSMNRERKERPVDVTLSARRGSTGIG